VGQCSGMTPESRSASAQPLTKPVHRAGDPGECDSNGKQSPPFISVSTNPQG